jgi:hypothetical protein
MYSLRKIKRGLKNPRLIGRELNRIYHTRNGSQDHNTNGTDVFEEDWDNLIILDACRYELFEQIDLEGDLQSRVSKGASTPEFLRGNFRRKKLYDTVYVTANPHFSEMKEDIDSDLFKVKNVWGGERWNNIFDTVMPETVTDEAIEAFEENRDKRLVVHYMQPHYPFVSRDEEIEIPTGIDHIWHKVMSGEVDVDPEAAWSDYRKTFDYVVEEVERLVENLEGKTVVTADHGNVYGERVSPIPIKEWGHPIGIYDEKLVKVPWLVIDGERREIKESENTSEKESEEEEIKDKLSKLGYK